MLSRKALAELKARGGSLASYLIYARACFQESIGNIRSYSELARSILQFVIFFHLLFILLIFFIYLPQGRGSFVTFSLVTLSATIMILLWVLLHIGLMRDESGVINKTLVLPNKLTIARLLLIAPVMVLVYQQFLVSGIVVYSASMATDVLDGITARVKKQVTRFGVVMDPLADVLCTVGVFALLTYMGVVPMWVFVILMVRYAHLIVGSAILFFSSGPITFNSTPAGKIVGVLQAAAVIIILAGMTKKSAGFEGLGQILYPALGSFFGAVIVSQTLIGWKLVKTRMVRVGS